MGVQVRTATFDGEGKSLPIISRQFISFEWGGKNIEDFDLLATVVNNRMSKAVYAPFTDTTKSYSYIDGQSYWGSTMQSQTINFNLSTDGMDSKKYEEFKAWFKPGIARKLILSEYPFRYAMARVSSAPQMSMLPFEKEIITEKGKFRTTEYKGDITLALTMDDPYWYQKEDCVVFDDSSDELILKDAYETGTPFKSELSANTWLANLHYIDASGSLQQVTVQGAPTSNSKTKLYYCGTAPARPIIRISGSSADVLKGQINSINIGDQQLLFTAPPSVASCAHVADLLNDKTVTPDNMSLIDFKQIVREQTSSPQMRDRMIKILNNLSLSTVGANRTQLKKCA